MILPVSITVLGLMGISLWLFAASRGTWMKVLAFSSLSIKGPLFLILWGSLAGLHESTLVAIVLLILGDLSIFLLSVFIERRSPK